MATRSLSADEIKKLVSINELRKTSHQVPFLSENIVLIAEAVKDNKSSVVIDGRTFHFKKTPFYGGSIHIYPEKEFVPCGYFALKTLEYALEGQDVD
jgi:hypothetical protein